MRKIVIYGAGDYAAKLYGFLTEHGCEIECFVVSEVDGGNQKEGIDIISIDAFMKLAGSYSVFIGIKNRKIVSLIIDNLENRGFPGEYIYDFSKFIDYNFFPEEKDGAFGEKECLLCDHRISGFRPDGVQDDIFSRLKIIGGGYREACLCPVCGSIDRTRWIYWILRNKTDIFSHTCKVLHFAPEKGLNRKILKNPYCDYYSGDIERERGEYYIDATDIQFKDDFFDYLIMNHVLEHIADEKKALSEMKRVLKKEGKLVLSFPVCLEKNTFEDSSICSDELRLKHYGQTDHVRLYGRDYKKYIEQFGFHVDVLTPETIVTHDEIEKYGFIKNDIVLICTIA